MHAVRSFVAFRVNFFSFTVPSSDAPFASGMSRLRPSFGGTATHRPWQEVNGKAFVKSGAVLPLLMGGGGGGGGGGGVETSIPQNAKANVGHDFLGEGNGGRVAMRRGTAMPAGVQVRFRQKNICCHTLVLSAVLAFAVMVFFFFFFFFFRFFLRLVFLVHIVPNIRDIFFCFRVFFFEVEVRDTLRRSRTQSDTFPSHPEISGPR